MLNTNFHAVGSLEFNKLAIMLRCLLLLCSMLSLCQICLSQQVTGTVSDRTTQLKLQNVEVVNLQTNEVVRTNAKGEFQIKAAINQSLRFDQPGYLPDTLFLANLKPVIRYLTLNNKLLNTIEINALNFNPESEYANVYRTSKSVSLVKNKPFRFSPSRIFGSEGRNARRFKKRMEQEKTERQIDKRFNEAIVKSITPLNGAELDYFMVLYRPEYKKVLLMDAEDLRFYVMNSYKEFKALPQGQRVSPSLQIK